MSSTPYVQLQKSKEDDIKVSIDYDSDDAPNNEPEPDFQRIKSFANKYQYQDIKIGLRFRIDQLVEIDTMNQTYKALCALDMDWPPSQRDLEYWDNPKNDKGEYEPEMIPRIGIRNFVEKESNEVIWATGGAYKIIHSKRKDGDVRFKDQRFNYRRIEFHCVFSEPFEVKNMPFDVQSLTFVFQSLSTRIQQREFVASRIFDEFFRVEKTYFPVTDWDIKHIDAFVAEIDWVWAETNGREHGKRIVPRMYFRIQVARKPFPYLARVVFWIFLLGIISFFMYGIPPQDTADRLGFAITMILAMVAFQFVVWGMLPPLPYLTLIDKYNLAIFVIALINSFEAAFVGWFSIRVRDSVRRKYDKFFLVFMLIVFTLTNIYFVIISIIAHRYEHSKIDKDIYTIEEMNEASGYGVSAKNGIVEVESFHEHQFEDLKKQLKDKIAKKKLNHLKNE